MLLFHSHDEQALLSWQSGVYYADGTPKASLSAVRDSLDRTRGGSIARCDGLALDVAPEERPLPGAGGVPERQARRALPLHARLRLGGRRRRGRRRARRAARVRGYGRWAAPIVASLRNRKLGRAPVRLTLTVTHPVNPGRAATRESGELRPA